MHVIREPLVEKERELLKAEASGSSSVWSWVTSKFRLVRNVLSPGRQAPQQAATLPRDLEQELKATCCRGNSVSVWSALDSSSRCGSVVTRTPSFLQLRHLSGTSKQPESGHSSLHSSQAGANCLPGVEVDLPAGSKLERLGSTLRRASPGIANQTGLRSCMSDNLRSSVGPRLASARSVQLLLRVGSLSPSRRPRRGQVVPVSDAASSSSCAASVCDSRHGSTRFQRLSEPFQLDAAERGVRRTVASKPSAMTALSLNTLSSTSPFSSAAATTGGPASRRRSSSSLDILSGGSSEEVEATSLACLSSLPSAGREHRSSSVHDLSLRSSRLRSGSESRFVEELP